MSTLSQRQQLFVLEYLADPGRNATQAAIRAGYSPRSARFHAAHLLHNDEINKAIQRELKGHVEKLQIDAETVVRGILDSIQTAQAAGTGAWQLQAIQRGWELLGKHLGMFKDKIDVNADNQIIAALHAGRRRAAGLAGEDGTEESLLDRIDSAVKKPN